MDCSGLAFHPQYATNARFFVYYTRTDDGTIVIAEYGVSSNPNVANPTETILLTIPHPINANHNGGMLAFGSDTFLYAGVGDGGSGNDPPNNAQNINTLLGKILRIDVDHPDTVAGTAYSSPSDNPYFGAIPGRDEIFSIGWRNPWRFSFDRLTQKQWVADVGQGAREEVDTPIVKGGNYGWRIYEGTQCTGNDPLLCNPGNYIFPIFDYTHSGGRCSITGGYVYRGAQGALPQGTYVYGDYCSGEILAWDGATQSVLLDTTMNISSFGEDEAGEVYVVNLGGSLSRIAAVGCTYDIAPASQSFGAGGGTGSVSVAAGAGCAWGATASAPWVHITSDASGSGNGTVGYSVDANTSTSSRSTNLTIAGKTFTVRQAGPALFGNYQGLWWNAPPGSESGWGVNLNHQGTTIFATWFTFGLDGKPLWLVTWAASTPANPNAFTGDLYTGTGPPYNVFDPAKVVPTRVGSAIFTFADANNATFAYAVNGVSQTKQITREQFGVSMPSCAFGAQANLATNFQDIWWNAPANSEPGWGVNLTHQGDTIFLSWLTFGLDGNPLWSVAAVNKTAPNVYSGSLVKAVTGPAFNADPFDQSQVVGTVVGTATLAFADGNSATFAYGIDGTVQTKSIIREVFASPGTVCQ